MIDARDHVGVPVVTSCPSYVQHGGATYELAPDALVMRESDLRRIEWAEESLKTRLTDWQRMFFMTPTVRTPHVFVSTGAQ